MTDFEVFTTDIEIRFRFALITRRTHRWLSRKKYMRSFRVIWKSKDL